MKRIFLFLLIIALFMSLVACDLNDKNNSDPDGNNTDGVAGEDNVVMSYEGFNLTEDEFRCIAAFIKDEEIYNQQYSLYQATGQVYSEADILSMYVKENTTYAELLMDYTVEFAQRLLIIEKLCADAGVTISNQTDIDVIEGYMSDVEYAFGGKDLFDVELIKLGFTRSGIKRYQSLSYLFDLFYESRYGENGTAPIAKESVEEYFLNNYYYFDGAVYSYVDSEKGESIMFEYDDDEVETYFYENYVKVRHILYKTVDSSLKPLSDTAKADKKAKAEAALEAITNGDKTFDDYLSDNEDTKSEYVFTKGEIVESFENAAFEMTIGEVRLIETESGYHIIEKLDMKDSDLVGTTDEAGKTTGSRIDTVKAAMSATVIREQALDVVSKLNSGELKQYPEKSDKYPYYSLVSAAFINKNDTNYTSLIDLLTKAEMGVYNEKDFPSSGTQIYRKMEFSKDDITSEIYATIEEQLAVESLVDYIVDYYDSVAMDSEYFNEFDIISLPLLDIQFDIK